MPTFNPDNCWAGRIGRASRIPSRACGPTANGRWTRTILEARKHLAKRDFAVARDIIAKAIAMLPQAIFPRVILSRILLESGDRPGAEKALRDVLALDPAHVEARGNLDKLLAQSVTLANLEPHERKVDSQNGEDGVLEAIFAVIGVTNRFVVEFGCEDATECNARNLLRQGWQGVLMDGGGVSRAPGITVHQEFITAENINGLLLKHGVPNAFDLLSIDIDGNDYWVWQAINARPRVVVIEYNAHVPPTERKVIAYEPKFRGNGSDYFGASLLALQELGEKKGYQLVYCERTGVNAFFIATEALPSSFAARDVESIYRVPNFLNQGLRHPRDVSHVMIAV